MLGAEGESPRRTEGAHVVQELKQQVLFAPSTASTVVVLTPRACAHPLGRLLRLAVLASLDEIPASLNLACLSPQPWKGRLF